MADVRIRYVSKNSNNHEGIEEVGNTSWRWFVDQVISSIEQGTNTFYTHEDGTRAEVAVRDGKYKKHLQTHADGKWTNNLLALPDFPASHARR